MDIAEEAVEGYEFAEDGTGGASDIEKRLRGRRLKNAEKYVTFFPPVLDMKRPDPFEHAWTQCSGSSVHEGIATLRRSRPLDVAREADLATSL